MLRLAACVLLGVAMRDRRWRLVCGCERGGGGERVGALGTGRSERAQHDSRREITFAGGRHGGREGQGACEAPRWPIATLLQPRVTDRSDRCPLRSTSDHETDREFDVSLRTTYSQLHLCKITVGCQSGRRASRPNHFGRIDEVHRGSQCDSPIPSVVATGQCSARACCCRRARPAPSHRVDSGSPLSLAASSVVLFRPLAAPRTERIQAESSGLRSGVGPLRSSRRLPRRLSRRIVVPPSLLLRSCAGSSRDVDRDRAEGGADRGQAGRAARRHG
jgi:hypothetical protein